MGRRKRKAQEPSATDDAEAAEDDQAAFAAGAAPVVPASPSKKDAKRAARTLRRRRRTLRRLLAYLKPQWRYALGAFAAIIATALLDLAQPWIMGFLLFGEVLTGGRIGFLPWVILLLALTFAAKEVTSFLRDYMTQVLSEKITHRLRTDVYEHLELLPMKLLDRVRSGELVSRVIGDTEEVEKVMTVEVSNIGADFFMFMGALSLLFIVNFQLAQVVVPVSIAIVFVVNLSKRVIKRSSKQIRESVADLTAKAFEVASGIRMVKSSARERHESEQFRKRSSDMVKARVRLARLSSVYGSAVDTRTMLAILAFIWLSVPNIV